MIRNSRNFIYPNMGKQYSLFGLFFLISRLALAQDPQFTQFYAAPLYLSPAFAGSALAPRITVNYRNQWPALTSYTTSMVGIDHYFSKYNSGVGLLISNDNQGQGRITSTDIGLQYSYQIQVSEESFLRLGLQGSYVNRNINYYGLTFGDQFGPGGLLSPTSQDPYLTTGMPKNKYIDFSLGGLYYADWFWVGLSAHHINRPSQAFFSGADSRLPMKGGVQAGLRIPLNGVTGLGDETDREISLSPAVLYKFQGKYDQLDVGAYLTYSPLTLGVWYRGLPVKHYEKNINNSDALAFLVGYRQDKFSIGYSYDATISSLGMATGGAHEISISYIFDKPEGGRNRVPKRNRSLPCPKF